MFQRHLSEDIKWTAGHTSLEFREGIIVGDIHKVAASMWFRVELCFRFRERIFMSWWQCHLGVWKGDGHSRVGVGGT